MSGGSLVLAVGYHVSWSWLWQAQAFWVSLKLSLLVQVVSCVLLLLYNVLFLLDASTCCCWMEAHAVPR